MRIRSIPPALYVALLAATAVFSYGFKLFTQGIFACPSDGYREGVFLADCNAAAYGDYDHGAFWYALEPDATEAARNAGALMVGSSRMQFGFSTPATRRWFENADASVYLLGFSHSENALFIGPLVERIAPLPRVLVINADNFFKRRVTPPASVVTAGGDAPVRYAAKRRWQPVHREACAWVPGLCGDAYAIFRDRSTGFWSRFGNLSGAKPSGIGMAETADQEWEADLSLARAFLEKFQVARRCIIITVVPSASSPMNEAEWLAAKLGLRMIAPTVSNLRTFDGSHLDSESAERWSSAFFDESGALLSSCLNGADS